jgi:hypothetical protein
MVSPRFRLLPTACLLLVFLAAASFSVGDARTLQQSAASSANTAVTALSQSLAQA